MRFFFTLLFTKFVDWVVRTFRLGAGSTWPGEIALRMDAFFIRTTLSKSSIQVIIVVGTNGKTTTSSMIVYGLRKAGKTVIHNPEGANLANGVASCLIRNAKLNGSLPQDFAVFEVDENAFSSIVRDIPHPYAILFLNIFRDQLDRYGEVHSIVSRWEESLATLSPKTHLLLNGDDPSLVYLGTKKSEQAIYFGAQKSDKTKKLLGHDVDSIHCPVCGKKLSYSAISYSHLGTFSCTCGFTSPEISEEELKPLEGFAGVYNRYNMKAALIALEVCLQKKGSELRPLLDGFKPAFGRQERIRAMDNDWILLLSKNPAGFNQSIQALPELLHHEKTPVVLVLNDRIPDGRDVSWIWDVEFEDLIQHASLLITSGDRTYDMAIRMKYCFEEENNNSVHPTPDLEDALKKAAAHKNKNVSIVILATYTGMLEARKLLVGKKLL